MPTCTWTMNTFLQTLCNTLAHQRQNFASGLASNLLDDLHYRHRANQHTNLRQQSSPRWQSFVRILSKIIEILHTYRSLWTALVDVLWGAISGFFRLVHVTAAFIFGRILAFIYWAKDICLELIVLPLWATFTFTLSSCNYLVAGLVFGVVQYGAPSLLCIWVGVWAFRLSPKNLPNVVGSLFSIIPYTKVLALLLIAVALQPFTQAFLLDNVEFLRAEPWWLTFLGLFGGKVRKYWSTHTHMSS